MAALMLAKFRPAVDVRRLRETLDEVFGVRFIWTGGRGEVKTLEAPLGLGGLAAFEDATERQQALEDLCNRLMHSTDRNIARDVANVFNFE